MLGLRKGIKRFGEGCQPALGALAVVQCLAPSKSLEFSANVVPNRMVIPSAVY